MRCLRKQLRAAIRKALGILAFKPAKTYKTHDSWYLRCHCLTSATQVTPTTALWSAESLLATPTYVAPTVTMRVTSWRRRPVRLWGPCGFDLFRWIRSGRKQRRCERQAVRFLYTRNLCPKFVKFFFCQKFLYKLCVARRDVFWMTSPMERNPKTLMWWWGRRRMSAHQVWIEVWLNESADRSSAFQFNAETSRNEKVGCAKCIFFCIFPTLLFSCFDGMIVFPVIARCLWSSKKSTTFRSNMLRISAYAALSSLRHGKSGQADMDHILRADGVGMLKSHCESLTWQLGSWLRMLQKIDGYEVGESAVLKKFDRSGFFMRSISFQILEKLRINQSTLGLHWLQRILGFAAAWESKNRYIGISANWRTNRNRSLGVWLRFYWLLESSRGTQQTLGESILVFHLATSLLREKTCSCQPADTCCIMCCKMLPGNGVFSLDLCHDVFLALFFLRQKTLETSWVGHFDT